MKVLTSRKRKIIIHILNRILWKSSIILKSRTHPTWSRIMANIFIDICLRYRRWIIRKAMINISTLFLVQGLLVHSVFDGKQTTIFFPQVEEE